MSARETFINTADIVVCWCDAEWRLRTFQMVDTLSFPTWLAAMLKTLPTSDPGVPGQGWLNGPNVVVSVEGTPMLRKRLIATAAALALVAAQVSPGFAGLGNPVYDTPAANDNTGHVSTTSFVATAIAKLKTDLLILLQQSYVLQVPSAAALRATGVFTSVIAHRARFYVAGDGGAADYFGNTSACSNGDDGGSCLNAPGGSWQLDWGSVGYVAALPIFGSICDGGHATQDTAGALAAAATGKNVYLPIHNYCNITAPIILRAIGQRIYGDGPQASKILAYTQWGGTAGTFTGSISGNTLSVTAVGSGTVIEPYTAIAGLSGANNLPNVLYVVPNGSGTGTGGTGTYTVSQTLSSPIASETMYAAPLGYITLGSYAQEVRSLQVSFNQPSNPANRAALITYPAAIMARNAATVLDDLFIPGGTTCIDMGGNTNAGNSYLYDVDTGCYDYGIRLDGSVDTVRIRAHHHFPYQMTGAQSAIFHRSANIAIDLGRMDDYAISDSLCLGTTCINLYKGTQGSGFGTVNNYDFDGAAVGIAMHSPDAALVGAALTFSSGNSAEVGIFQTGGKLAISGSSFFLGAATQLVTFQGGVLSITGSEMNQGHYDSVIVSANAPANSNPATVNSAQATPSRITLSINTIERDTTVTNNPWFKSVGSEIVNVQGNSTTPGSSGTNISIANDTAGNRVIGNSSPGRANYVANAAMPNSTSPSAKGVYFGN